jgi:hypothetical protein
MRNTVDGKSADADVFCVDMPFMRQKSSSQTKALESSLLCTFLKSPEVVGTLCGQTFHRYLQLAKHFAYDAGIRNGVWRFLSERTLTVAEPFMCQESQSQECENGSGAAYKMHPDHLEPCLLFLGKFLLHEHSADFADRAKHSGSQGGQKLRKLFQIANLPILRDYLVSSVRTQGFVSPAFVRFFGLRAALAVARASGTPQPKEFGSMAQQGNAIPPRVHSFLDFTGLYQHVCELVWRSPSFAHACLRIGAVGSVFGPLAVQSLCESVVNTRNKLLGSGDDTRCALLFKLLSIFLTVEFAERAAVQGPRLVKH